jgi:cyclic dehypoxanthinyl futalosine synthase
MEGSRFGGASDDLAIFGPGLDMTKDEENRRLPRITQRHVLSIVSIGSERRRQSCKAVGNSREPPAAIRQSCHAIKRLPSRRWDQLRSNRGRGRERGRLALAKRTGTRRRTGLILAQRMNSLISSADVIDKVLDGDRIDKEEALELYRLPIEELGALADHRRKLAKADAYGGHGNEIVTYIVERNINYTNVCNVYCKFCAFYRTEKDPDLYVLPHEQIDQKIDELVSIGGVQILMQGGHNPKLGIDYYLNLLSHIRERFPQINIHAFSPPEFNHFAEVFGMPMRDVILKFREAGLGSIPGGGGEILVDRVRNRIAPLKCNTEQWLRVMEIAHEEGLRSSATMMFGHVETIEDRIEHLDRIRELQDRTGGFTAFICWTFQPENVVLKAKPVGSAEYLRTQALARIYLDNVENLQSSWVTQGPKIGQLALSYGANDYGSVMMEENVVSSAGTTYRLSREEIERLITEAGYEPHSRNNVYSLLN